MKNTLNKAAKEVSDQMEKQVVKGEKPDYKGTLDVAAWFNKDGNGNTYLSVALGNRIKLVPNEEKLEDQFN